MASSVMAVGVLAVAMTACLGLGAAGAAAIHAQRLSSAADAAALAAADTLAGAVSGDPCTRAAEVAASVGVQVATCDVHVLTATVTVTAPFGVFVATTSARAGPAPGASG